MPISSSYRRKTGKVVDQPWNTTKPRRLSTTLPPSDCSRQDDSRSLHSNTPRSTINRSDNTECFKKSSTGVARPAWVTGSFEKPLFETSDSKNTPQVLTSKRTLKRRETLPEFSELSLSPVPKFKRANSDSLIKPCESGKRKVRRAEYGRRTAKNYRRRLGESSGISRTREDKVDSETKITTNNGKLCFNDFHQTPKQLGQRVVCVLNKHLRSGVVHYLGSTHFSEGQWCGIALDEPCGKNDGCVKGVRYFTCGQNHGIFVHAHKVRAIDKQVFHPSHNTLTDGPEFRESEENLASKISPMNIDHKQKFPMDCSEVVDFQQNCSTNNTGCTLSKARSNSFSGSNLKQIGLDSTNGDGTQGDLSRSTSLPKISSQERVCSQEINNDSKSDLNINPDNDDSNDIVLDKLDKPNSEIKSHCDCNNGELQSSQTKLNSSNPCSLHNEINSSNYEDVMTDSTSSHNGTTSSTNITREQRSYSSGHITSLERKLKHNSNNTGPHAALERNHTIDAFVQDKYCSCPSLVPSQHLSSALEACIDLGRQEFGSHSDKTSLIEEEKIMEINHELQDAEYKSSNSEDELHKEKLPHHGRSKSLPLVLVPVRNLSQTESLFWSSDKLSGLVFKEERSESWPTLSTSACRLDLRPDNKLNEDDNFCSLNVDNAVKTNNGTLNDDAAGRMGFVDDKQDTHVDGAFALKKQKAFENLMQSDTESFSQSGSQVSMSSDGTNESRKGSRKASLSSTSSTRSQTKQVTTKSQNKTKVSQKLEDKKVANRNGKSAENYAAPFKLVKRNTVSSLQKYQPATTRPSLTKRPTSTLSERGTKSSTVSPSFGKSKLPTIKKTTPVVLDKPTPTKPPARTKPTRPSSIALQGVKKVPAVDKKKEVKPAVKTSTPQRKPPPPSQNRSKTAESPVKKRTKATSKPSTPESGTDKKISTTSTKTTVASKPKQSAKPSTPQNTTGSPLNKSVSSTSSKHYHSRLPRKVVSRDESTESSHSHECDVDSSSIATDGSDYLDQSGGIPVDHYDADRSDLESTTRSWQYAPDILTGTREIHTRSVEVQVGPDEEETEDDIKLKYSQLERLLREIKNDCRDLELNVADRDANLLSSAILIVALCKKFQNNGRLIMHMKKDLHFTELELKQMQERLAEEEADAVKLQEEMMYIRSEHTVAIQNLKADHENTLEAHRYSFKKKFAEDQAKANEEHVKELLELNKVHAEKEAEIKKRHVKAIAEENEKYRDEIVEVESKHSQHVDELLEEHQVEIEIIKTDYEEQHSSVESKLFAVTNECTSLNMNLQNLQEETERDIESRIQEAIEKYKALPAELESMKAVLDMKNEDNKQLKKEIMESKMELDHLRKVAERAKKLEHENESLSFVVQNKSKFERQLSVEHEHLKTTLDRESKKLKRLSLENEELQWKLYNSPSPTEETASSEFSVNGSPPTTKRRSFRLSSCSVPDVDPIVENE